jgi:hypothetical protein
MTSGYRTSKHHASRRFGWSLGVIGLTGPRSECRTDGFLLVIEVLQQMLGQVVQRGCQPLSRARRFIPPQFADTLCDLVEVDCDRPVIRFQFFDHRRESGIRLPECRE